jgi:hypothetical protein
MSASVPGGGVDWTAYEPFDPGIWGPLREQSAADARGAFDRLMAAKEERKLALSHLLKANGIELVPTDEAIQRMNDWFRSEVEPDSGDPTRLRPLWYAVVNDLALYLGDVIVGRNPGVAWTIMTRPKDHISFQRHVLTGFAKVPNPNYNIDIDRLIATYGQRAIAGLTVEPDEFVRILNAAARKA